MAMNDEFDALIKNKTWELVPRPPNVNVIRYMWIFTHKEKSNGDFERHKAVLPRAWYKCFADYVSSLGFQTADRQFFVHLQKGSEMAYMLLYVDDIILLASSILSDAPLWLLTSEFAMKDLGPLNYFLGIHVTRHKDGMFLSQRKYAEEIIDRAGMSSCKATSTPVDTKLKVSSTSGAPYDDPTHYRSLAGALQYLTFTWPDISYAVQQVCLHMHAQREVHMHALKRIIRYIQGTT
ncbi:uncharacterized mitochondrial protein AtMg00810-like [Lycium ferocissimum]|uniref:uncharacterized mitochondrial protein AtMg00810-like n=1 Tax=Lycium ferocissimum TaxID=112874 RepID=UPI00281647E2|nr:uncharacterized mitochondrial protein AtMg00810-like [Lycium ferocissimum]